MQILRERTARRKHNSEYEVSTTFLKAVNCVDTIDIFTSAHVSIPSEMQYVTFGAAELYYKRTL